MPPESPTRKAGKCNPADPIGILPSYNRSAKSSRVKWISLFLLPAGSAEASLLATMQTSRGNVVIELQYAKAPQAVANFITLSQGTRAWVDPSTGAVKKAPFYDGLKIHRVVNSTGFKVAQGGSPKGDGSDGPGFTFKDEFDATLTHAPYVFSMANSGPNTNGSQFFFTGNVSIPSLNNVHTVFGLVTDPASRAIVDAILAAGANNTTITGVSFSRTDPAAEAFNELAQNLPAVIRPSGTLVVNRNVSAIWNLNPVASTGAVFRAFRSTTLTTSPNNWSELTAATQHVGITPSFTAPVLFSSTLDSASNPKAFYNLSLANHPGSVAPSTLANRTITVIIGSNTFIYTANSGLTGGTCTLNGSAPFAFAVLDFSSSAHHCNLVVDNGTSLSPSFLRYLMFKIGCDSATSTLVSGRHSTSYYDFFTPWAPLATGSCTISR
jgi:cyclophilin family peptidyl-prolyl cis-trans isomerase